MMVCLLFGANVQAQGERELLQQAREAMERGQELYAQQDYAAAAEAFLQAYAARPFSAFLYNAGISYERLGDARRSIEFYERYIEAEPHATDAEEVRERIARLRAALMAAEAQSVPTPEGSSEGATPEGTSEGSSEGATPEGSSEGATPEGTSEGSSEGAMPEGTSEGATPLVEAGPARLMKSLLSIETVPADAQITLRANGQVVGQGRSPFTQTLDEGRYNISVEHPDYRTVNHEIRVRPGKVYVAILELSQGEFLGYLRVVSDPPGASVYLDDREQGAVGRTPYLSPIPTGEHHLWVERPGYQVEERDIEISIGEDVALDVSLERVTYGRLRVVANAPGAKVLVDGREVGNVPYEGEFPAGVHRVTVRHDGLKDWEEEVELQRGQLTPLRVRLRPAVGRGNAWALLTTSILAAGGGLALAILGDDLRTELRNDQSAGRLASDDNRFFRGKLLNGGANAAFGLAGFLGLLSIYFFVRDPLPDSEGTVLEPRDWTLIPTFDPVYRAGGADFRWSF